MAVKIPPVRVSVHPVIILLAVILAVPLFGAATTAAQARAAVAGWLKQDGKPFGANMGGEIKAVKTFTNDAGENTYYVVELQPAGYVVVPADDQVEPIVAFSASGIYDPSPNNPLAALVKPDLEARLAAAHKAQTAGGATEKPSQKKWAALIAQAAPSTVGTRGVATIGTVCVAPLLQTYWNQLTVDNTWTGQACYNYYTPSASWPTLTSGQSTNYYCGCVATAMAQLMYYHKYPTTGVGTGLFPIAVNGISNYCLPNSSANLIGGDMVGGPYNWAAMVDVPDATTTPTQCAAIGALCYDAGVSVQMCYSMNGSGAWDVNPAENGVDSTWAFANVFNYSNAIGALGLNESYVMDTLYQMINPNLDAGYPVMLGIQGQGGHEIVCDGYGYQPPLAWEGLWYHHLNLGWGIAAAGDDVWYNLPVIDTLPGDGSFLAITSCVYNIFPDKTGEIISGFVLDNTGTPLSGAVVGTSDGSFTSTTNAQGIYALVGVNPITAYTLTATLAGYKFSNITVTTGISETYTNQTGNLWGINFETNPPVITSGPTVNPSSPLVCQPTYFSVTAAGNGPLSYKWDFGDGNTDDEDDQSTMNDYENSGAYTVTVTVTDVYGCSTSGSLKVKVASSVVARKRNLL